MDRAYYSVIPATIMQDPNLSANEKLLYAELTSLANKKGYCFASNKTLAERFGASDRTIRRWLQNLIDRHYLAVKVIRNEKNEVVERRIYINDSPSENEPDPLWTNLSIPQDKTVHTSGQNCPHSNTYSNTLKKDNTTYYPKKDKFVPPTVEEIREYCKQRGNQVDPQKVFDFYSSNDWKDSRGNPVKNWKQKIIGVWEKQPDQKPITKKLPDFEYKKTQETTTIVDDDFLKLLETLDEKT